ncbi:MAG: hypothetical protein A2821_02300 [Candidatus Magasanikbacteria bacterium RIFCSPHIGHO2_01_FULL_41_23]|uniref:Uncharacterized protein n=1 Tax=Candidatus Magasanikbacteria bacterium RIFCSPLOWO2_01_FULL_40_15 TaxID=1798686 RepID=A0A1F6N280_9BACT|nr:MAG: hypothetical protein A2821_02300 [Candidatus Magasanikbacteria bacterium RIFCSPHIGHO2_01_FULL_41_23]OGH66848.1 MAG: hypothetical protein A3C66_02085 [Candidatus Magasanikbacteria bacterium RIFCSPHIGHO2_02_FULL_41_35]OGH74831.1 MAG: hypothetical protein A3F22_04010 [Candidatus Magasanikbacteria bacterium RIFCSPHIGHO2_12_FULL_41_16]OGH78106.1 MAG: hypothetical protein A2983_03435 [Candidatus Magasanikbacteria bacterium RIFCSPLOWO2_01_FULL_40_15]
MTLRKRIFIINIIVTAIILAIFLYLVYGRESDTSIITSDSESETSPTAPKTITNQDKTNITKPAIAKPILALPAYSEELYVRQLAKIFVERFASYSTQNDNNNITDSLDLATVSMQTWMKTQLKPGSRDYEGVVTQVLASSVKEKTASSATVDLQIQQNFEQKTATAVGATQKEMRQKKGTVKLLKIGDQWKIDGLYWE